MTFHCAYCPAYTKSLDTLLAHVADRHPEIKMPTTKARPA